LKNQSLKIKLILTVMLIMILLGTIITTLSINRTISALKQTQMSKLTAVKSSKAEEILTYFTDIKALILSLATNKSTKDALIEFKDGFYKLKDEINLEIPEIKKLIENDFTENYINNINYDVPNSPQKKDISSYLPEDENAIIAQYIFITKNNKKIGEKNNFTYSDEFNSTYMKAHKKYHSSFNTLLNNFHLYDIFIADLNGNIIYTDFKEKDFATNLKNGIYNTSGLGNVYKKALDKKEGEISFEDFAPYEPSYNNAASFIATPIFIDGKKQGILIFQMPVDNINAIMNFNGKYEDSELGESGECYLVGSDYKMRNNSRFLKDIDNPIVQKLNSTIGVWEIKTDNTKKVFEENKTQGQNIIKNYRDTSVLSTYMKLNIFDEIHWALIAEIAEDEALNEAYELKNLIILSSFICIIISIVILYIVINNIIAKPIENFKNGLLEFFKFINKENFNVNLLNISSNDEIGLMSKVINKNIEKTRILIEDDSNLIENVKKIVESIKNGDLSTKVEISTHNKSLEELKIILNEMIDIMTEKICSDINKIDLALDQLQHLNFTHRINENKGNTAKALDSLSNIISNMLVENKTNGLILEKSANSLMSNVSTLSISSNKTAASLEETASALEEITSNISNNTSNISEMANHAHAITKSAEDGRNLAIDTTHSMEEINEQVNSINDAITIIDQIAFQTNILSLNAAVEAATAGEAGKGFAVVAQEVRNLASRSSEAAKEIKNLVQIATTKANNGKDIANKMIDGYHNLNENIIKTLEIIKDVELASKEQQIGIEQINDAITQLDQQTQQNAQVATFTKNIAIDTLKMAKTIVDNANKKEFTGKDNIII
jgi:methyl-accepting chemotaxis protein